MRPSSSMFTSFTGVRFRRVKNMRWNDYMVY